MLEEIVCGREAHLTIHKWGGTRPAGVVSCVAGELPLPLTDRTIMPVATSVQDWTVNAVLPKPRLLSVELTP